LNVATACGFKTIGGINHTCFSADIHPALSYSLTPAAQFPQKRDGLEVHFQPNVHFDSL
jgi:hypothetical protein